MAKPLTLSAAAVAPLRTLPALAPPAPPAPRPSGSDLSIRCELALLLAIHVPAHSVCTHVPSVASEAP